MKYQITEIYIVACLILISIFGIFWVIVLNALNTTGNPIVILTSIPILLLFVAWPINVARLILKRLPKVDKNLTYISIFLIVLCILEFLEQHLDNISFSWGDIILYIIKMGIPITFIFIVKRKTFANYNSL